jgi:hypothetical protein
MPPSGSAARSFARPEPPTGWGAVLAATLAASFVLLVFLPTVVYFFNSSFVEYTILEHYAVTLPVTLLVGLAVAAITIIPRAPRGLLVAVSVHRHLYSHCGRLSPVVDTCPGRPRAFCRQPQPRLDPIPLAARRAGDRYRHLAMATTGFGERPRPCHVRHRNGVLAYVTISDTKPARRFIRDGCTRGAAYENSTQTRIATACS